ncbi:MAG: iron-containing alcohol dehydrogenase family protein [Anaerolineae bacterium]
MTEFYLPTQIITGRGCLNQVSKLSTRFGDRVLLVSGVQTALRGDLVQKVTDSLHSVGHQVFLFAGVSGEADLDMVAAGLACLRKQHCTVVVGLGGGSALDTAKAIAGLATLEGDIYEYHSGRMPEKPGLPFIAIPTTAGTGAEVTKNAVLTNPRTQFKQSIRGDDWFARVALVDPELTLTMSPELTASTGSDALCQAIEAFTSIASTAVTDALAEKSISIIGQSLLRAYEYGNDLEAREGMSMGSLLAGMAMSNARLGAVHGLAHPLGAHYHIPHGVVCGLLLPYVMDYNLVYTVDKYARVACLLGCDRGLLSETELATRAVEIVRQLLHRIGIPEHLASFGVHKDDLQPIIAEALPSGSTKHNIRPMSEDDLSRILVSAL